MPGPFADPIALQHRLFAELSAMFGQEVPLYDKSLLVNLVCNRTVCALLGRRYPGFAVSDEQIEATSAERHGAIRIGRPDEYRWIGRFFAVFAMEPHNFYDMTALGGKSQPVIATAFRSRINPEHRVFTSLLMTDYFDEATKQRIDALLAGRRVFSDRAKELIERCEAQGGLDDADAESLITEATQRIFKWTGQARGHELYRGLCEAGFKIAADVACFESHHLNHLTPNTFCMDLYTSAMKRCLGELDDDTFARRASTALRQLHDHADRDWMTLHFKHLSRDKIDALSEREITDAELASIIDNLVAELTQRLHAADLDLSALNHNGFKDFTEGPDVATPVLLRQDAYKALTEPVTFRHDDGTTTDTDHTARFGEIEQRFYATTPKGRALYDQCLAAHEANRAADAGLAKRDFAAYQAKQAEAFAPFPKTLAALLDLGLAYGKYSPTDAGRAAASIDTTDLNQLVARGFVRVDGLRYEDFLPFSAAGIFASNLNQYGTASTAAVKPDYSPQTLEEILGRDIIDTDAAYLGMQAASILDTYEQLGLLGRLDADERERLERAAHPASQPTATSR